MRLFEHQKSGVEFLKKRERAILADEMGLGKTIQAIKAVEDSRANTLVICPASLKINWQREISAARPADEVYIINGRKADQADARWIIINYDVAENHKEWIKEKMRAGEIENLILDEAHYIKGRSKRAKATLEIADEAKRVYCLTGTPLLNRPVELWNLLLSIKHPLTISKGARTYFSKKFCGGYLRIIPPTKWRRFPIRFWDESGATNLSELRERLKGYMLRRKKNSVLNLPAKVIDVVEVELSREQRKEYDNAWDSYIESLNRLLKEAEEKVGSIFDFREIESENMEELLNINKKIDNIILARQLVELQKLKRVCSRSKVERIVADAKNAIDQGEKIIVFTQYVETLEMLKKQMLEIKYDTGKTDQFGKNQLANIGVSVLSGATNQKDRQKAVDEFQNNDKVKVFIGNIKAAGVGITLTKASIVIFADMDWTPEVHSQAEDRAHRIGQNRMVNVYYYVAEKTIEMDIIELLAKKKQMVNEVIDGTKDRVQNKSILPEFIRRMSEKTAK